LDNTLDKVIVVKIGGATLGNHDTTLEDIVQLQKQGKSLVVVHGGGKRITQWLEKQGITTQFVLGERVTDPPALEVVTAVLAGLVNKEIVAAINTLGGKALGISGVDGALVQGKIKDAQLGLIGTVTRVDTTPIKTLLAAGYVPVIAPVSLRMPEKAGKEAQILNINADSVAGEIAAAVSAARLIFLTDIVGICDKQGKLIPRLSPGAAEALIASGVASAGMVPKIRACLKALPTTPNTRIIDGRQPHALLTELAGKGSGTTIGVTNE